MRIFFLQTTHESGGVIVPDGLCVSERLEDRVGLHDLVLEGGLLGLPLLLLPGADHGEVRDDLLGVLGLPGTGFATAKRERLICTRRKETLKSSE